MSDKSFNLYNYGRVLPGEIVKKITDFSVAGKRKLDVGFYSSKKLDQISEGIQRKKFLTLINTITVTLFNTILFNKMELGENFIMTSSTLSVLNNNIFRRLHHRGTDGKHFKRCDGFSRTGGRRKFPQRFFEVFQN